MRLTVNYFKNSNVINNNASCLMLALNMSKTNGYAFFISQII